MLFMLITLFINNQMPKQIKTHAIDSIKYIAGMLLALSITMGYAQDKNDASQKSRRYSVYLGAGPSYYFNNLVTGKDLVNEFNYSFSGKIMWEPEHRVSVGIETGYYRLYTANTGGQASVHISNIAVPVHLAVSVNLVKAYYFEFSLGPSFLTNKVHSDLYGDFDGSSISLADMSGSLVYKSILNKRLSLNIGPKFFYSSHLNDKNIALLAMVGYKL
jgi:hypothetical protein